MTEVLFSGIPHCSLQLERVFRDVFFDRYNTVLMGGLAEPIYWPAGFDSGFGDSAINRLCYRQDYYASALHEISHWCIAGEQRRRQVDFGYWYVPDGRTQQQQQAFQHVEIKPQALEWLFSVAAGRHFSVSVDNLNGGDDSAGGLQAFSQAVRKQALSWCRTGLPKRAEVFIDALAGYYGIRAPLRAENFRELPA